MKMIERYKAEEILMGYEREITFSFCRHCGCEKWNEDYNIRTLNGCVPNVCKKWCDFTQEIRTNSDRAIKRIYGKEGKD